MTQAPQQKVPMDCQREREGAVRPHDLFADRLMLAVVWGLCTMCIALSGVNFTWSTALFAGLSLALIPNLVWFIARGTLLSRATFAAAGMGLVTLQIHQVHGMIELHFGVFVLLAILLVYRDWRVIAVGATVIAVLHLLFDYLQIAGTGVYCFVRPGVGIVLIHAGYVVVESLVLGYLAVVPRRQVVQAEELDWLVTRMRGADGAVDLSQPPHPVQSAAGSQLVASLGRVRGVMTAVLGSADVVAASAREISSDNSDLAHQVHNQLGVLHHAAEALDKIVAGLARRTQRVGETRQIVEAAAGSARTSGETMAHLVTLMSRINASAARVMEINEVIDAIAFQTNILALNAAVEAARAGEHGKGFAVVASEVRSLAQRCAASARDVAQTVGQVVEQMKQGAQLAAHAGVAVTEVIAACDTSRRAMDDIVEAAARQSQDVADVGAAVSGINDLARTQADLMAKHEETARQLDEQADQLFASLRSFAL